MQEELSHFSCSKAVTEWEGELGTCVQITSWDAEMSTSSLSHFLLFVGSERLKEMIKNNLIVFSLFFCKLSTGKSLSFFGVWEGWSMAYPPRIFTLVLVKIATQTQEFVSWIYCLPVFQEVESDILCLYQCVKLNVLLGNGTKLHCLVLRALCCGFQKVSQEQSHFTSSFSVSVSHALRREQSTVSFRLKQLKLIKSKSLLSKRPWIQLDQKPLVKQPLKVYQKFISMVIYLGKHIKMLIEIYFFKCIF